MFYYDTELQYFWRPASPSMVEKHPEWYDKVKLKDGRQVYRLKEGVVKKTGQPVGRPKLEGKKKGVYPKNRSARRSKEELLEIVKANPKLADKYKSIQEEVAKLREQGLLTKVEPKTRAGKIRKAVVEGKEKKEAPVEKEPFEEKEEEKLAEETALGEFEKKDELPFEEKDKKPGPLEDKKNVKSWIDSQIDVSIPKASSKEEEKGIKQRERIKKMVQDNLEVLRTIDSLEQVRRDLTPQEEKAIALSKENLSRGLAFLHNKNYKDTLENMYAISEKDIANQLGEISNIFDIKQGKKEEEEEELPFKEEKLPSEGEEEKVSTPEEQKKVKTAMAQLLRLRTMEILNRDELLQVSGMNEKTLDVALKDLERQGVIDLSRKGQKTVLSPRRGQDISKYYEPVAIPDVASDTKKKLIDTYKELISKNVKGDTIVEIPKLREKSGLSKKEFDNALAAMSENQEIDITGGDLQNLSEKKKKELYEDIYVNKRYLYLKMRDMPKDDDNEKVASTEKEELPFKEEKQEPEKKTIKEKIFPKKKIKITEEGNKYKISFPLKDFPQGEEAKKQRELIHDFKRLVEKRSSVISGQDGYYLDDYYDKDSNTFVIDKEKAYLLDQELAYHEGKGASVKELETEQKKELPFEEKQTQENTTETGQKVKNILDNNQELVSKLKDLSEQYKKDKSKLNLHERSLAGRIDILDEVDDAVKSGRDYIQDSRMDDYLEFYLKDAAERLEKPYVGASKKTELPFDESPANDESPAKIDIEKGVSTGLGGRMYAKKDNAGKNYLVSFPYNEEIIEDIKAIEGRKYNSMSKRWEIPAEKKQEIEAVMKKYDIRDKKNAINWHNIEGETVTVGKKTDNPDVESPQSYKKRNGLEYRDGKSAKESGRSIFENSLKTIKGKTSKGRMSARIDEGLEGYYVLEFPYDAAMVKDVKNLKGRYSPSTKEWHIPIKKEDEIIKLMEEYAAEE